MDNSSWALPRFLPGGADLLIGFFTFKAAARERAIFLVPKNLALLGSKVHLDAQQTPQPLSLHALTSYFSDAGEVGVRSANFKALERLPDSGTLLNI